jgi:dipeptide/tripeptide permease
VCRVEYPETLSSLNPLFCMALLLVPAIGAWSALRERMAVAMLSIAAAFGLLMLSQHLRGGDSIAWLVGWYALGTLGEALISPLGMDLVTSLVPRRYAPLAMSLWLLSMSAGGKLAGLASVRTVGLTAVACVGAAVWFWVSERPAEQPAPSAQLTANQL